MKKLVQYRKWEYGLYFELYTSLYVFRIYAYNFYVYDFVVF